MYFGALCKKETMLGLTYLRNQTKISYFFILVEKMNHILQECHHDYNGNLVDTNTKKKVWSVCPFLLDGIYSSLCESVMRTTGNKKFKVFSHNISCMYTRSRVGSLEHLMHYVEKWEIMFTLVCQQQHHANFPNDLFHFHNTFLRCIYKKKIYTYVNWTFRNILP